MALADLRHHIGCIEHNPVVVRVGINEARRQSQSRDIAILIRRSGLDGPRRSDRRNLLTRKRDVADIRPIA